MTGIKIFLILTLTLALFSCATTEESAGPRTVVYRADGSKTVTRIDKTEEQTAAIPSEEKAASNTVEEKTTPKTVEPQDKTEPEAEETATETVKPEEKTEPEAEETATETVKPEEKTEPKADEKTMESRSEESPRTEVATEPENVSPVAEEREEVVIVDVITDTEKEKVTVREEETVPVTIIEKGDMSSIVAGFNYAYGVKNMNDLKSSSISIIASYFALGLYDASLQSASPRFLSYSQLQDTINDYVAEYYALGISFDKGERPYSIEELTALSEPEDLKGLFSYAYGYSIVSDLIAGGVDIEIMPFMTGMLDSLYSETSPLTDTEIENALNLYIMYLNEEYYQSLENLKEENRAKAEAFLEENGKDDSITVLESGVQLMILDEDEELGATPTQYDTVIMDYNEYVLDYDSLDIEIIDSEFGAEINLISVSNGLQSAVTNMKVGQAVRAFIPPALSGLEDGNGDDIAPYSVIVYDIALNGIL